MRTRFRRAVARARSGSALGLARPALGPAIVLAVLVALAVLGAAFGLALAGAANLVDAGRAGRLLVRIDDPDPAARAAQRDAAMAALRDHAGADAVRLIPDEEAARLMAPWIGPDELGEAGPPALIDVALPDGDAAAAAAIVKRTAPAARIDADAAFVAPIAAGLRRMAAAAFAVPALVALAAALIGFLAGRAAILGQQTTIAALRMLGGDDPRLLGALHRPQVALAFGAGAVGLLTGAVLVLAGAAGAAGGGTALGGAIAIPAAGWGGLVLVAVAMAALASWGARIALVRALARLPR